MTIELHPASGLFQIRLPDGTLIVARDGGGLSKDQCEQILDAIENGNFGKPTDEPSR